MRPEHGRYYLSIGAAMFPIPAGQKSPIGIVSSFATDCSRNPLDWVRWEAANKGCNFGIVAGPSKLILCDVDIKVGQHRAAEAWRGVCADWGCETFKPQIQSARGGQHCYFQVPDDVDATTLREPDLIKGIINVRAGNGFCVAAGSYYNGRPKGEESGWYSLVHPVLPYLAPAGLIEHCLRKIPAPARAAGDVANIQNGNWDPRDVAELLRWLNDRGEFGSGTPGGYRLAWITLGMALKVAFGDAGFDLWLLVTWEGREDKAKSSWRGFASVAGPNDVTLLTWFDRAHKLGWPGRVGRSLGAMFGGVPVVAALPPPANAAPVPAGTPGPARNALVGSAEAAIIERGTPVLAGFLAGQSGRPQPGVLRLPESMAQHGLYVPLNDALGHVAAIAQLQRQALLPASITDVLGVLGHVHADTYAQVLAYVRAQGCILPEWSLSIARRQFENQVRRDLRTGAGYRVIQRTGAPDPQNVDNVTVFLRLIGVELRFNVWKQRIEIRRNGNWSLFTDNELNHLRGIASQEEHGFRPAKEFLRDMLGDIARQTTYDPVLDFIDGVKWDGVPRLNIWLSATCGVVCDPYHQCVGRNIIGGMVKRARKPGCKHDEVVFFLRKNGTRKERYFQTSRSQSRMVYRLYSI
jgi:hypothetical protein